MSYDLCHVCFSFFIQSLVFKFLLFAIQISSKQLVFFHCAVSAEAIQTTNLSNYFSLYETERLDLAVIIIHTHKGFNTLRNIIIDGYDKAHQFSF